MDGEQKRIVAGWNIGCGEYLGEPAVLLRGYSTTYDKCRLEPKKVV
jgi:hypothetical protein